MTSTIIITLSLLLLLAYLFDISASKTKIPAVILLLILGFLVKHICDTIHIRLPDLNPILPILGTVGLILIVLEGALELDLNRERLPLILQSTLVALIPIICISLGIAFYLHHFQSLSFKFALANAIPLAIISSSIAIPSAKNLPIREKEFITYESSLSDIFGVLFFNFITLNDQIDAHTYAKFGMQFMLMLLISAIATLVLAAFLNRIKHHIKFMPMILIVLLIYTISKIFHLPALLFILIFGLFIGNIDELRHIRFIQKFHPVNFSKEVFKFKEITTELAFLIRALFFILFGFLIDLSDVLNTDTIPLAIAITLGIFIIRAIVLYLFKIRWMPLLYMAPRGLITILLFLSIPIAQQTYMINKSLITQVIILTAIGMMYGLMRFKHQEPLSNAADHPELKL